MAPFWPPFQQPRQYTPGGIWQGPAWHLLCPQWPILRGLPSRFPLFLRLLFENPLQSDSSVLRKYRPAPHPFVLRCSSEQVRSVAKGDSSQLPLTVFGRAVDYFPSVVQAILQLGQLGLGADHVGFSVESIEAEPDHVVIYEPTQKGSLCPPAATKVEVSTDVPKEGRLRLHYVTPLRLLVEEYILCRPAFAPLVSAALRRLELLCRVHQAGEFAADAPALVSEAANVRLVHDGTYWQDLSRHSQRQGREMPMGGLLGSLRGRGRQLCRTASFGGQSACGQRHHLRARLLSG